MIVPSPISIPASVKVFLASLAIDLVVIVSNDPPTTAPATGTTFHKLTASLVPNFVTILKPTA